MPQSQFLAVPVTFTFERPQDLDALVDREPPYSPTSSIRAVHHTGGARRPAYPPGLPLDDRDSDFMLTFGMPVDIAHVHVPVMAAPPTGARERKTTNTNATAGNSNPPSYEDAVGVPLIQITLHDERATNSWSKMARLRGRVSGSFQRNHKNTVADTSSSSTIPFSLAAAAVSTLDLTHSGTGTTPQRPARSWSISQSLRSRVNSGNVLGTNHTTNRPALPFMDPQQHAEPETRTMRSRRVRRSRSFSGFAGVQVHGELDLELLDQLDEVGREAYLALQGMMDSESGDREGPL
ncbi:hypothetical protein C8F01DRAFT_1194161 [Mycena amicta]|nr:hypothetical protein C8F01DRAFT_1194161 [Mycena amicta]